MKPRTYRTLRPSRSARSAGFSLIEILVALAVFGIGVLGLALVIPLGVKNSNSASQQSRASQLAAARAEALLDATYADDDLSAGLHDDPGNPISAQYYVQWNVEVDQPIAACKRVTITVRRPTSLSPIVAQLVIVLAQSES